ncbi:RHS repeat-associated core domain-containing protein [Tahibacter amnicola]|uniref:RHS repeat-associated protein n=1 Tax=Tahibacter amnicola TaxID=2976241 RepID=A0ABY6BK98_9GAMM|nr:RHS repeat-associated core domain-containing protein [Tahibacter amnicola]UXI70443.1 hypothetical protein N4264_12645 [Tahibacter amnicola]
MLDEKGQVKESRHADGSTTKATYNAIGKIATSTDALGRVTHYTYTDRGEEERVTFPDATYTEKTYDEEGNVLTERDRDGRVTTMKYDAANRLKETIYPDDTPATLDDNPRTVNHYDKAGQLVGVTDARNQTTTYKYDDAGRQTHVINALQQTTETIYDKAGRREAVIDSLGRTTRFIYDAANRLTETIHPDATPATDADNPRTFAAYDAAGRKVKETDEMGRVTRFAYDALGRLTQVILPNPANGANPDLVNGESPAGSGTLVTRYGYDELGNKLTQKDAEGRTTSWTFDKAQRPLTRTLPLGQTERFHYDALGRKDSHTDFRGRTTAFRYKPQTDYLETIDYPTDPDVTLTYTAGGELHTVQDANGTTVYANDVRGRLERVTWPVRPGEAIAPFVEYQYDANGNRTKLTTPNQVIDYQFDALNRLDKVLKGSEVIADYGYDGVGNRDHLVYANGTRTDYAYNLRNRLTGITHKAGTSLLLGVVYTVDASGLRTAIDETGAIRRHVDYRYDKVKRLENETAVAQLASGAVTRSTTWTYGKTGNRLTQSKSVQAGATSGFASTVYGYDANDRLDTETVTKSGTLPGVIAGITRYTYDEAGNTIKKVAPDETVEYAYDDANRMSELKTLAGEVTRYAYNHAGIRLSQTSKAGTANAKTSHYLIDPNQAYAQVIEEATQQGTAPATVSALYTFGDDRISQFRPAQVGGGTTPGTAASLRYYHADGLGSTRLLTSEAGTNTDVYGYEAFGELDSAITQQASSNDFLYTGEQMDPNSGIYYLRARYMDPVAGRFTQQDAFSGHVLDPLSLNKYVYASNLSSEYVDPSGYNNTLPAQTMATSNAIVLSGARAVPLLTRTSLKIGMRSSIWAAPIAATAAATAGMSTSGLDMVKALAHQAQSEGSDRLLGVPVIVFGGLDFPGHALHIALSQIGISKSGARTPYALNGFPEWDRSWLKQTKECNKKAVAASPGKSACDEFPFASARQGGPVNYMLGSVSLQLLDRDESSRTGPFIRDFYKYGAIARDGFSPTSRFFAFGAPGAKSFFIDRNGLVHNKE